MGKKMRRNISIFLIRLKISTAFLAGVLLAFWAFETDFGAFQGNYNTRNALVTLAHDCRRPELFRPQIFAALELFLRDEFNPETTQGAWPAKSAWCKCCPKIFWTMALMGMGMGLLI